MAGEVEERSERTSFHFCLVGLNTGIAHDEKVLSLSHSPQGLSTQLERKKKKRRRQKRGT